MAEPVALKTVTTGTESEKPRPIKSIRANDHAFIGFKNNISHALMDDSINEDDLENPKLLGQIVDKVRAGDVLYVMSNVLFAELLIRKSEFGTFVVAKKLRAVKLEPIEDTPPNALPPGFTSKYDERRNEHTLIRLRDSMKMHTASTFAALQEYCRTSSAVKAESDKVSGQK